MLDSSKHSLMVAALALAVVAIMPSEAHASREAEMLPDLLAINVMLGSVALFGTMDIIYMARGEPLPTGWAIAQLAIPTPIFLGLALFSEPDVDQSGQLRAFSAVVGMWFLGHAVINLLLPREREREPSPGEARTRTQRQTAQLDATIAPTTGGAMVLGRLRL